VRHIFRLLRAGAVKLSAEDEEGADGCCWRHCALRPARRAVADYTLPQRRCRSDMSSRANEIVPGTGPGGRWRFIGGRDLAAGIFRAGDGPIAA
jgi:hypothetical protein